MSKSARLKIGRFRASRPWQVYDRENPPEGIDYVRCVDPSDFINPARLFLVNTKLAFLPRCDGFMTYNAMVVSNKPWVVEVESWLPRYGMDPSDDNWKVQFAFHLLSRSNCIGISFTSRRGLAGQEENLRAKGLWHKATYIPRPTPVAKDLQPKPLNDPIRFIFVGNAFYRKGGVECLKALNELTNQLNWEFTIISSLEVDWAVIPDQSIIDYVEDCTKDSRVRLLSGMPWRETLDQIASHHVSLMPTYNDSWNNVVAESIGHGTPVITTNVRNISEIARPEFANIIPFKSNIGKDTYPSDYLVKEIVARISDLLQSDAEYSRRRQEGYEFVRNSFGIKARQNAISEIWGGLK